MSAQEMVEQQKFLVEIGKIDVFTNQSKNPPESEVLEEKKCF